MDKRDAETVEMLSNSPFERMQADCEAYEALKDELAYAEANYALLCAQQAFTRIANRCQAYQQQSAA